MYSLPDVAQVRSISKTGLSVVTVVFKDGTDIYFARQLVFEQLQAARANIPDGVGTPEMGIKHLGVGHGVPVRAAGRRRQQRRRHAITQA